MGIDNINDNRCFDLLRGRSGRVCARAMALALESDLRTMIGEAVRGHGYDRLKEEQLSAIEKFVSGQDDFVSLPTGFGQSVIYGLLPTIFDRLKGHTAPTLIALIVSPLASLMVDQKARFLPRGISAEYLGEMQYDVHALQRVRQGHHSLVLLTSMKERVSDSFCFEWFLPPLHLAWDLMCRTSSR